MLTPDQAIVLADRHQQRAVREAAGLADALGQRVGFVRRAVPGGATFEAVALDAARTCAIVDEHGALRFVAPARRGGADRPTPAPAGRLDARTREAAERALRAAARPRAAH
jgi:hypothetical protein